LSVLINQVIWGYPLLVLLFITSIVLCFKTRFIHIRYLSQIPKLLLKKSDAEDGSVSSFTTTMLLLGSHIGVGNIIGVSLAIMMGGPGSIFWMWITAFIFSVLSFFENTLGQLYKQKINNSYKGGPAYYILYGLNAKLYSKVVSLILFVSIGLLMPMVQTSTIITSFNNTFGFSKLFISIGIAIIAMYLLFSKGNKLMSAINVMVPFMALFYIILSIIIIVINISNFDNVLWLIINSAFNKESYYGGLIGVAFSYGIRRGAFSNEAGMGTSPNISSQGYVEHPVMQGIISSFCVFFDTLLVCSITAFMILLTGKYNVVNGDRMLRYVVDGNYNVFLSEALNTITFDHGYFILTLLIFFFAFTSIMGSFVNAQSNLFFLLRDVKYINQIHFLYKFIFIVLVLLSGFVNTTVTWLIADLGLGLIAWVNLLAIILLSKDVFKSINDYKRRYNDIIK
jgi:alanine or glycine:cation symporter, AGCS family